ncbi:MAG: hypothetical protein OXT01_08180, partial [Rhodospirillaceae bacterium]|nr:hypothetical protein [Rhodospirillaceae bacterium]
MTRSPHAYADTVDEATVRDLAETCFAEHHSPVVGESTAAALIPNGGFRPPVPRAVAVECLGDVAVADVIETRRGGTSFARLAFERRGGHWQPLPATLH